MTSAVDTSIPADGVPANKAQFRANWATIKAEIEQFQAASGGWQAYGTFDPSLIRFDKPAQRARVTISANDTIALDGGAAQLDGATIRLELTIKGAPTLTWTSPTFIAPDGTTGSLPTTLPPGIYVVWLERFTDFAGPGNHRVIVLMDDPNLFPSQRAVLSFLPPVPDGSGELAPVIVVGASNGRRFEAMGVAASITGNRTWYLQAMLPPVLPAGTAKLKLRMIANSSTGDAKVNPSWGCCAAGESFDLVTVTAEGTQTLTLGTGDENEDQIATVVLDAATLVAGTRLIMNLVMENTGWTVAVPSYWTAEIVWEE